MDVAGQNDVRSAQPRRRRYDALADTGCVDAHHRRILEYPRPCPPRQHRQSMDILAAIDLEGLPKIDAMEITIGLEVGADTIDLPSLGFGLEILAKHLQFADQAVSGIDVGDLQRTLGEGDA